MTQLFDSYGENYSDTVAASISFSGLPHKFFLTAKIEVLLALFADHFGPSARPSLLDVGCGVGLMHRDLRLHLGRLAGCDTSDKSVRRAEQQNPGVTYRVSNGSALPWDSAQFDCALAVCVAHHIDPANWNTFAAEMRRVVRPGGLVVLIEHNPYNPLTRLAVLRCPFDEDAVLLSARRARALLRQAGCADVKSRHFLLLPAAGGNARAVERWFERAPLGAQYLAFGTA